MFGKAGELLGRLQEMKQKAEEIKQTLSQRIITEEGAGGDIKIEITGDRKIKRITITPALQHGDNAVLTEQLEATLNRAIEKADRINEEEMKKAASGMLPGII
jgi:nucleoid-associated protein EbfC